MTDLGDRVQGSLNAQDSLRVSRDRLGDVDTSVGLVLQGLNPSISNILYSHFVAEHQRY